MKISVRPVMPNEVLFPRIAENCAKYDRRLRKLEPHEGIAVIVGGGPSMRHRIQPIQSRAAEGQTIFALNGACGFLNKHGIMPDYQVLLDPQPFLTRYIGNAREYLVSSQCDPLVLAATPEPVLGHVATEGAEEATPHHPDGDCLVGGGLTVGLCSMCLVYTLGYRKMHLYGFDSSCEDDTDHAYPSPSGINERPDGAPVVVAELFGNKYRTTWSLAAQAETFPKVCNDLIDAGCTISVHSEGLIMAVVREMQCPTLQPVS